MSLFGNPAPKPSGGGGGLFNLGGGAQNSNNSNQPAATGGGGRLFGGLNTNNNESKPAAQPSLFGLPASTQPGTNQSTASNNAPTGGAGGGGGLFNNSTAAQPGAASLFGPARTNIWDTGRASTQQQQQPAQGQQQQQQQSQQSQQQQPQNPNAQFQQSQQQQQQFTTKPPQAGAFAALLEKSGKQAKAAKKVTFANQPSLELSLEDIAKRARELSGAGDGSPGAKKRKGVDAKA